MKLIFKEVTTRLKPRDFSLPFIRFKVDCTTTLFQLREMLYKDGGVGGYSVEETRKGLYEAAVKKFLDDLYKDGLDEDTLIAPLCGHKAYIYFEVDEND